VGGRNVILGQINFNQINFKIPGEIEFQEDLKIT
jgi:hypothetical protein